MSESDQPHSSENPELDELLANYLESADAGSAVDRDQFIAQHPEHADALGRYFENVAVVDDLVQCQSPPVDQTIMGPPAETAPASPDQTVVRGGTDSETSVTQQHAASSTAAADKLPIPEQFGRYKIEKCLGQGAMGAVYLAHDTQLDRRVALKIPKFTDDPNGELLQRFYREARAAATLRSPNICPVFDVGDLDGQHYITMAFIEGRPLKDFTKSKKDHSEKQIAVTIRKLALALEEAHEIGVVHRDLKPANIMVDKKGEPVVMDFGLARRSSSDDVHVTQSGAILGTPAYMSPEQIAGDQKLIGPQCDIYALGVIMYELMTGEMPFKGNMMSILQQIAVNKPKPPSELREGLDPRLEEICRRMMASDLAERYGSMKQVAQDLQEILRNPMPKKKQKRAGEQPKPTAIPSSVEESNPALVSLQEQPSITEQLRQKRASAAARSGRKSKTGSKQGGFKPPQSWLIAGGMGGAMLLLGIVFFFKLGKYDVQITLDDPSISISVDGDKLRINDGQDVIQLSAGEHTLLVEKEGLKAKTDEFIVSKDGKTAIEVKLIKGQIAVLKNGEQPPATALGTDDKEPGLTPAATGSLPHSAPSLADRSRGSDSSWGRLLHEGAQHGGGVWDVDLSPGGRMAVSGGGGAYAKDRYDFKQGRDYDVHVCDGQSGKEIRRLQGHSDIVRSVAISEDSRLILSASWDRTARLWDAETGKQLQQFVGHDEPLTGAAFVPGTEQIATTSTDGTLRIWNQKTAERLQTTALGLGQLHGIVLSPEGRNAYCGTANKSVQVIDLSNGKVIRQLDGLPGLIHSIAVSADGAFVAAANAGAPKCTGAVWEMASGKKKIDFAGHVVAFVPGSQHLFVGDESGNVQLLDLADGRILHQIPGHSKVVQGLAVSADGLTLLSGSWDGTVKFWSGTPGATGGLPASTPPLPSQAPNTTTWKSALQFDGIDDYVAVPSIKYDGKSPLTIEVRLRSETPKKSQIIKIREAGSPNLYIGWHETQESVITFYNHHLTGTDYVHAAKIWDGHPTHIAGVIDTNETRLFIDGRKITFGFSDSIIAPARRLGMTIGAELAPDPIHHYKGVIEGVRLSSAALYDKDFAPPTEFESNADTLALYKFDEGEGNVLKDSSGNGHDGKILGATWVKVASSQSAAISPGATGSATKPWETPAFQKWVADTQKLPAEQQLEAVSRKLVELNPGFDGKLRDYSGQGPPRIENGVVTGLGLHPGGLTDLSPLRALQDLEELSTSIDNVRNQLSDLSPLKGMNFEHLRCSGSVVSDFSPLLDCPNLRELVLSYMVSLDDLSGLRGLKLTKLWVNSTKVSDLTPLSGMPLTVLHIGSSHVIDLSPLKGMPLRNFFADRVSLPDLMPLKECQTLRRVDFKDATLPANQIAALQKALPNCEFNLEGVQEMPAKGATGGWPASATDTPPLDPDRTLAEWVLSIGGTVNGGQKTLSDGSFSLRHIELGENKRLTSADLDRLVPIRQLKVLQLHGSALDESAVPAILKLRNLRTLFVANTGIPGEALARLAELPSLTALSIDHEQLRRMARLPSLPLVRNLSISDGGDVSPEWLDIFPRLSVIRFGYKSAISQTAAQSLQAKRPNLRILHFDDQGRQLIMGRDPEQQAVIRLRKKGIQFSVVSRIGTSDLHLITENELSSSQAFFVRIVDIPATAQLDDEDFAAFSNFYLAGELTAKAFRQPGRLISALADQTTLEGLDLSGSSLGDQDLENMSSLVNLTFLTVSGTSVTRQGLEKLHRQLPQCRITSDFGAIEPEFDATSGTTGLPASAPPPGATQRR